MHCLTLTSLDILLIALGVIVGLIVIGATAAALYQRRLMWIFRTNRRPKEAKRVKQGLGKSLSELCLWTGLDRRTLIQGVPRYSRHTIAKRRGGRRHLQVPDDATKTIQRTILRRVLAHLHAHPAATGFERGRSIVDHARPHVGRKLVVTMDVIEFFRTTTAERIDQYFRRVGWDAEAAAILTSWTTHEGGLPQGAPTSPRLSNLVNYYLDVQLTTMARRRFARYTRYGDDIALSFDRPTPRRVRGTIQCVRRILKAHGYESHGRKKTRIQPAARRQVITGLVVNQKVNLPRRLRRTLRAAAHHHRVGRPATLTEVQLQGWAAFQRMVEAQREAEPA